MPALVNAQLCSTRHSSADSWHLEDVLESRLVEQQSARTPLKTSSARNGTSTAKQSPARRLSILESDVEISPNEEYPRALWNVSNAATDSLDQYTETNKCTLLKTSSAAGISDLMQTDL